MARPYRGESTSHPDPSPPGVTTRPHDRVRTVAPQLVAALIADRAPPPPDPPPAPLLATMTKRQRQVALKAIRTAANAKAASEAAQLKAAKQETADEKVAPAAQRLPVLASDGTVLYHPRLMRDGVTFIRSNPLAHALARGQRRTDAGLAATITADHARAGERLSVAWETAGQGVSTGVANYGERIGGKIETGWISDETIAAVAHQRRASVELEAVRTWLGPLWPVVFDVVLRGLDISAWAEAHRMERKAAPGYLAAALTVLVAFYAAAERPRRQQLRAVTITSPTAGDA